MIAQILTTEINLADQVHPLFLFVVQPLISTVWVADSALQQSFWHRHTHTDTQTQTRTVATKWSFNGNEIGCSQHINKCINTSKHYIMMGLKAGCTHLAHYSVDISKLSGV